MRFVCFEMRPQQSGKWHPHVQAIAKHAKRVDFSSGNWLQHCRFACAVLFQVSCCMIGLSAHARKHRHKDKHTDTMRARNCLKPHTHTSATKHTAHTHTNTEPRPPYTHTHAPITHRHSVSLSPPCRHGTCVTPPAPQPRECARTHTRIHTHTHG